MFKKSLLASVCASLFATTSWAQTAIESATSYTYHPDGQIHTIDGPRTDVVDITTYTYYADTGLTHVVTNALGHTTTYDSYNASGQPTQVTDNNGLVTTMTYHPRGWLETTTVTAPSGASRTTSYQYDAVGQITRMQLPTGAVLNYEYDNARRLTAIENGLGERIEYTLDAAGNRTREEIKDTNGAIVYSVARAFDELSRVMDVLGNDGQHEHIDYDADDNPIGSTDAKNALHQQVYDNLNRLKTHIDPYNEETEFSYDSGDRIHTVTDARGNTTTYEYDALGHLLSVSSPDTGLTTYTYDAAGNRKTQTDSRGVTANYSYDALNRLLSITYPSSPAQNVTYRYSETTGYLTAIESAAENMQFAYDEFGQLITKTSTRDGVSYLTQYAYDAAGQLTEIIYPSDRRVAYSYDVNGRISAINTHADGNAPAQAIISNVNYLPFGPARTYTYGNGLTHTLDFDTDYRIINISVAGTDPVLERLYEYDVTNNINAITDGITAPNSQAFDYDLLGRLISADGAYGNLAYSYDAVGNRLTHTRNGATSTYTYDINSNQLDSVTANNQFRFFMYDAAGNPLQFTTANYVDQTHNYNAANRLTSIDASGENVVSYQYNALGQRIYRATNSSAVERYFYDENGQLISVTSASGETLREYIYWGSQRVALVK